MEEKKCYNCKNFINYYTKKGLLLRRTSKGHCTDLKKSNNTQYAACQKWEAAEEIEISNKKIIEILLESQRKIELLLCHFYSCNE